MSRLVFAFFPLLFPAPARASAVDLHLHLPMIEKDVRAADLEKADVRLAVAVLYAPPVLSQLRGGYARELLRQAARVRAWAAKDPRVGIVTSPEEAERIVSSKDWRLGLVLAVEGAGGADSEEKLDRLWDAGVRMLTITHFKDTRWGGAADVRYWPLPSCRPGGEPDLDRGPGLGDPALLDWAVRKGLLLDFTHASDKTVTEAAARHPELPLLFTHAAARDLTPCERALSPELLKEVRRSGGLVGLTVSANYLGAGPGALRHHARVLKNFAGPERVVLGSDFNGVIKTVPGAASPADYAGILEELRSAGLPVERSAEAFVEFWKRSVNVSGSRSRRP